MFKVVSYNILFSKNSDKIIQNIPDLANQGVSVFCLQEVVNNDNKNFIVTNLIKKLGSNWQAICNVGEGEATQNHGTCILWDNDELKLKVYEKYLLPKLKKLQLHESFFIQLSGHKPKPMLRRAISATFTYMNKDIKITNVHLDHVGGPIHRKKQLKYLLDHTNKVRKAPFEIYCGDFNSIDLLNTGREKVLLQKTFGNDFREASTSIKWTADLYNTDSSEKQSVLLKIIKPLHLHIQRKLDYIWVKNLVITSCKEVKVEGSDHLPIVATFKIN